MKKLLKIGDKVYGQSIQQFVPSYLQGFPQREKFLLDHLREHVVVDTCSHPILRDASAVQGAQSIVAQAIEQGEYDALLLDNPLSILAVPDTEVPILFDCIDWYEEMYEREFGRDDGYRLLQGAMDTIICRADLVVAQSPTILEDLMKRGLKTNKTAIIPNGYDEACFFPYKKDVVSQSVKMIEDKHNISLGNKKILVYTGKLNKWYSQIITIAHAVQENQVFLVVGDGPLMSDIPKRSNVVLCGAVRFPEVPLYTNIADVAVFPVSQDCSPIAVSEYLAVGKPIVLGYGRMNWLLADKINAAFVNPASMASWRDGIRFALEHQSEMRQSNLLLANKLSWKHLAQQFDEFLGTYVW